MKEIQEWNGGKAKITVGYGIEIRNIITKCDFFFFLLVLELMKSLQQSRTRSNIQKTGDELEERNKGDF